MNIEYIVSNFGPLLDNFLSTPSSIIAIFIGAAGVSILTQVIKWLGKLKNDKVITGVLITTSFLASALDYFISSTTLPPTILGFSTVFLIGAATPVYRYVVKPLSVVLTEYRKRQPELQNKASEMEAVNKVSTIEQAVISEETKTDDGETQKTSVITPVVISAPKPLAEKPAVIDF